MQIQRKRMAAVVVVMWLSVLCLCTSQASARKPIMFISDTSAAPQFPGPSTFAPNAFDLTSFHINPNMAQGMALKGLGSGALRPAVNTYSLTMVAEINIGRFYLNMAKGVAHDIRIQLLKVSQNVPGSPSMPSPYIEYKMTNAVFTKIEVTVGDDGVTSAEMDFSAVSISVTSFDVRPPLTWGYNYGNGRFSFLQSTIRDRIAAFNATDVTETQ